MGTTTSICSSNREKDFAVYLDKILELQREIVIKELILEETQKKLSTANKMLEDKKFQDWKHPHSYEMRNNKKGYR
uniref:Uncharacterized protein n=1 Tax=viral metagenome TaxID=1070528 RepID=A0A6C0JC45_9ZZZZ